MKNSTLQLLKLLQGGVIAAGWQLVAALIITIAVLLANQMRDNETEAFVGYGSSFLFWAYLFLAFGFAMTKTRYLDHSAERMCYAAHLLHRDKTDDVLMALVAGLGFGTLLFVYLALYRPHVISNGFDQCLVCDIVASSIWPGAMSVGVAFFGATTHAAIKARQIDKVVR